MRIGVVVLRPEPGNARTAARLRAVDLDVLSLPLFAVTPIAWTVPDWANFDAVLLTSANAVRHGGAGLSALASLPVIAVGAETAAAARRAGFSVAVTGSADAAAAITAARANGLPRLLHVGGRERSGTTVDIPHIAVYGSDPIRLSHDRLAKLEGRIALLHSARAAERLASLIDGAKLSRATIGIVALSEAVRAAGGAGWAFRDVASSPTDEALVTRVQAIARSGAIDPPRAPADKAG